MCFLGEIFLISGESAPIAQGPQGSSTVNKESSSISVDTPSAPMNKATHVSPFPRLGRIILLLLGCIICSAQVFMATRCGQASAYAERCAFHSIIRADSSIPFYPGQVMFAGESKSSCFGISTPICTARTLTLTCKGLDSSLSTLPPTLM